VAENKDKRNERKKSSKKHCPISHYGTEESESLRPFRIAEKKLSLSQTHTNIYIICKYKQTNKQTNTHFQGIILSNNIALKATAAIGAYLQKLGLWNQRLMCSSLY
jgi:hypothetical protein